MGDELDRLLSGVSNFVDCVQRAVAHKRRDGKGMQVPFFGDFCSINPSALKQLEWWSTELAKRVSDVVKLRRNQGMVRITELSLGHGDYDDTIVPTVPETPLATYPPVKEGEEK